MSEKFPGFKQREDMIQFAVDIRAETMKILHEERDKDRALLERMVNHLTVPPRSTWRVVQLAGDDTPHDVGIEFPAQVVYVDNGSTANVQVRAPGDIAQSPPIAASGQGAWLIPGATQLTVTGTGTGQVRLRFLNEAAARLLYTGGPGGSTASPLYAELTGSLAPHALASGDPVTLLTIPYTSFSASTTLYPQFVGKLHRNAIARTFMVANGMNQPLTTATLTLFESTAPVTGALGDSYAPGAVNNNGQLTMTSENHPALAAHVDSGQVALGMGATAPTSGDVYVLVTEVL